MSGIWNRYLDELTEYEEGKKCLQGQNASVGFGGCVDAAKAHLLGGLTENFSYPRLTTVLQDYKKIAQILFDDVVDPSRSSEVHHDIVDVALSIGETTGPVKK